MQRWTKRSERPINRRRAILQERCGSVAVITPVNAVKLLLATLPAGCYA